MASGPDERAEQALAKEREDLRLTAVSLARWQGEIQTTVAQHEAHLSAINGSLADINSRLAEIQTALAVQKWALGLAAGAGSILGGALVTWVLSGGPG